MTKVKDVLRTINQIENRLHLLEIKACKARDKYDNFIVLDVIKLELEIKEIKDKLNLKIVEEEVGSE
jgi:hypothetical protein